MKMKSKNIIGALKIMDDFDIKPNYSALQRKYGIDRHTISKYHKCGGIPDRKSRNLGSKWDPYLEEVKLLFELPGTTKMGIYQALQYKYNDQLPGTYNSFKAYTLRQNLVCTKEDVTPHVLYETEPGEQIQVDWKEELKTHTKNGDLIEYNVFGATLGYSRLHIYIYSVGKTEDDFIRCVIETFKILGGTTKILKTDNMAAIVAVRGPNKKIHARITAFFKDLGVELRLCEARSPETKGKCESSNRFVNWIKAFDYQVENEEELIKIIEKVIPSKCNKENNKRTGVPPAILFEKEKEHLTPLQNTHLLESYIQVHKREKVPSTLLITYSGASYSVPSKYIGKVVDIYVVGSELYIYHNSTLITVHTIQKSKTINYKDEHYKEALSKRIRTDVDAIKELAEKNLNKLKKLGGD